MNLGMFACNFQTNSKAIHHQTHDLLLTKNSRLLGHRAIGPGPLIGKTRRKIVICGNVVYRRMLRVSWMDKLGNQRTLERAETHKTLVTTIAKRQMSMFWSCMQRRETRIFG